MLMGVPLHIGGGVSACWWGCLCMLIGVSLYIGRGVSVYW